MITDRFLENSWGYRLNFQYERLNDDAYRRGYSFDPQSEIGCLMTQWGLIPLHAWFKWKEQGERQPVGAINTDVHDSLFFSVRREYAFEATQYLVTMLEQPRMYHGETLSMPCEIKVGTSWKAAHEWKRMPTQPAFEEVVYGL
jgi:hypothetical protein